MSVAHKDGIDRGSFIDQDRGSFVDQISYDDLYRRWEDGNWKATELDLTEDRKGWESLSEIQRKSALWTYWMFFYGEDSVADNLSPYIDAAPLEEQKYFLATQQVDEARHAVFFHRFFVDVMGAGRSVSETLGTTLAQPGQHFIEDFFASQGTMPAFSEGMHNVARDEQRHIGFGVKVLSE